MGIDRPNIRFVIHTGMPKSIEHYQQEAGRAGRDRLPAECALLFGASDAARWRQMLGEPQSESDHHALAKLSEMARYCQGLKCRHKSLVEYFGQPFLKENCGHCDVCLGEYQSMADAVTVSRQILSAVARLQQRFGAYHVAQTLKGQHRKIRLQGHDRLSVYGLLQAYAANQIGVWIDQLTDQGFLYKEPVYGVVQLTASGALLLKGESKDVWLTQPPPKEQRASKRRGEKSTSRPAQGDDGLFEALRVLRRELAAKRNVPPYVIFSDVTLREMAARQPRSLADFGASKAWAKASCTTCAHRFWLVFRTTSRANKPASVDVLVILEIIAHQIERGLHNARDTRTRQADHRGNILNLHIAIKAVFHDGALFGRQRFDGLLMARPNSVISRRSSGVAASSLMKS